MDLRFYKLRVCSTDILLIDDLAGQDRDRDWPAAAHALLDRRRGAGAEQLAVLSQAESALWLRVFESGGDTAASFHDAALCAARYLLDSGRGGRDRVELRVSGGLMQVDVLDAASLGLSLGPPRGIPGGETLNLGELASRRCLVESGTERYEALPLALGSGACERPGVFPLSADADRRTEAVAVLCEGGTRKIRVKIGGATPRSRPRALPIRLVARGELWARPPRGIGAATAAGIALAAAAAAGQSDREALVRLPGGALWVEWTESGSLYTGARPDYVYRGEFHLDDYKLA